VETPPPAQPHLDVSPPELDFGSQIVGSTSVVRAITLSASDRLKVKIDSPDGDFAAAAKDCQLGGAASCAINVTFAPKQAGTSTSYLAFTVTKEDGPQFFTKTISLTGTGITHGIAEGKLLSAAWFASVGPVFALLLLYLIGLVLVRWNMVALPTRRLLQAQIDAVTKRVEALPPTAAGQAPAGSAEITALLTSAKHLIRDRRFIWMIPNHFLWTRGEELAGWSYVHEAEEQLVFLLPPESVRVSLERAETDLRQAATPAASGLADKIHEALGAVPPLPPDRCRPVLQDVLASLTPRATALASEVNQALDPAAGTSQEQCHDLAVRLIAFLNPQSQSLAAQIQRVLATEPPPEAAALTLLLQQVVPLLETQAAPLSQALATATASPNLLTVAQWQPILATVRDYLTPQTSVLAEAIRRALAAEPGTPIIRWRALLAEALGLLYDRTDASFATLISWHNKTMWLIGCGLFLIASLAATLQHEVLFLVGATGGLLSRMSRSLSRAEVPTDYGASWTSLFLSPVVGALAGWSGILLVITGVELKVLGPAINVSWYNPYHPLALGLAFLLGFSERAFDGILTQLEAKVQTLSGSPQSQQAASLRILTAATLPNGKVGSLYDQVVAASGGVPPYKWTRSTGLLPSGVTLEEATGRISGKPLAANTFKFTLRVNDAASGGATQEFTIVVVEGP
jgi:hypothetical protein